MKKFLIVGLGNIGNEYINTRHNIGFDIVDTLGDQFGVQFITSKLGTYGDFRYRGKTLVLLKPSTYMNLSGKAVKYYMNRTKIGVDNLLIVADDLALPMGKLRLRGKGSHAGHNGLRDIEKQLNTPNYPRLKFGIGNQFPKGQQVNYVLSFAGHGLKNTMNQFN